MPLAVKINKVAALLAMLLLQIEFCSPSIGETDLQAPTPKVEEKPASNEPLSLAKARIEITVSPQDIVLRGKHGLKIQVKNNTDRPIIFNGEEATAKLHQNEYKSMNVDQFDELFAESPKFMNKLRRNMSQTAIAAVTVGGAQTAYDAIKSSKPVLKTYGQDEERRQEDQERFGQRILWPGDSSTGVVLFSAEEPLTDAVVSLPVASFFDANDKALVSSGKIEAQTAN